MQHTPRSLALATSLIISAFLTVTLGVVSEAHATDDPYVEEILHPQATVAPTVVVAAHPRWGKYPVTQLRLALGWTAIVGFTELSAPSLEASLAWRFRGVSERLGFRLSAYVAGNIGADQDRDVQAGSSSASYESYEEPSPLALGANLSLEISWPGGFYVAPGVGVYHFRGPAGFVTYDLMPSDCGSYGDDGGCYDGFDCGGCGGGSSRDEGLTSPELTLALGWEYHISSSFALVAAAQGGVAFMTARISAYVGVVLDF